MTEDIMRKSLLLQIERNEEMTKAIKRLSAQVISLGVSHAILILSVTIICFCN